MQVWKGVLQMTMYGLGTIRLVANIGIKFYIQFLLTFARLMNQGRPTDGRKIGQKFILDGSLSKQTSINPDV
jgi:hypothetical protein